MKRFLLASLAGVFALGLMTACDEPSSPSSDQKQQAQQEQILQQGTQTVGMPNIKNFREKKLLKDILELRDQDGLVTYTYVWCEMQGKYRYLGQSIGYGIPYATQFTNPQKIAEKNTYQSGSYAILPQADPNGLFSPSAAEGTWVMMKDPGSDKVLPLYIENRVLVSPFKLANNAILEN
jgi:hypothetical protein